MELLLVGKMKYLFNYESQTNGTRTY